MTLTPLQEKWLSALESGNYKQGQGKLRNKNGEFCCLGVACEVLGLERQGNTFYLYNGEEVRGFLTPQIAEKLGLRSGGGQLLATVTVGGMKYKTLYDMNDYGKMTFKDIAAYVRSNLSNVFVETL